MILLGEEKRFQTNSRDMRGTEQTGKKTRTTRRKPKLKEEKNIYETRSMQMP